MQGITVILLTHEQTGVDAFNRPIYTVAEVPVNNVLVAPLSGPEVLEVLELTGRKATYILGIPKTDSHIWENQKVKFFDHTWRVIGKPTMGIDALIPLAWNKKVIVESIDGE